MRVVVVGSGPVGLFCGMALARRGHDVSLVDRDAGPHRSGQWRRKGVMQFHLPHAFRPQVHAALAAELPDALAEILAAGAIAAEVPFAPGMSALQCRRSTFERGFRAAAAREPRLDLRVGHVDAYLGERGRVTGLVVDGDRVDAELVVAATGRAGRIAGDRRAPTESADSGFSYVARMYRARTGVDVPVTPIPFAAEHAGYITIAFPQDASTVCALIVRPSADRALADLRHEHLFQRATAAIPNLAAWTDTDRFQPITPVMAGAGLANSYRSHLDDRGQVPLPGLLFVGDAVSTTNPAAGRGVTLGLLQAQAMLHLLDADTDLDSVVRALDAWCTNNIRPWYDDHRNWDATLLRRFAGGELDLDAKIPSDVIAAAAEQIPKITPPAGRYRAMLAPPNVLAPYEEATRTLLRTGWRPPVAPGPTRDELADLIRATGMPVPA